MNAFGTVGAHIEDITIIQAIYHDREVKTSGGVLGTSDVQQMIDAGATCMATSSGVTLVQGQDADTNY